MVLVEKTQVGSRSIRCLGVLFLRMACGGICYVRVFRIPRRFVVLLLPKIQNRLNYVVMMFGLSGSPTYEACVNLVGSAFP